MHGCGKEKKGTQNNLDRMLRNKHRTNYTRENILKKTNLGTVPVSFWTPVGNYFRLQTTWTQWFNELIGPLQPE